MEKQLMLYYPLLDPIMEDPDEVLEHYAAHGCRLIEVALPCENPVLDGPVIRNSMKRILELSDAEGMFDAVRQLKRKFPSIKVQLVSYIGTIETMGYRKIAELCRRSQVDYLLSPDASDEQLGRLDCIMQEVYEIPVIRFLPFTGPEDMLAKAKQGRGYLFMQSADGRSGGSPEIGIELKQRIAYLRNHGISLPIIVGFGIKNRKQVKACYQCGADGVTIGSGLLEYIAKSETGSYLDTLTGGACKKREGVI